MLGTNSLYMSCMFDFSIQDNFDPKIYYIWWILLYSTKAGQMNIISRGVGGGGEWTCKLNTL
jgi:hypothetical protein